MSKKQSLLFQIQPKKGGPVGYVFGTMHVADARAFSFFEKAKNAAAACDFFSTEFNLDEIDAAAFQAAGQLPDGQKLTDFLTPSVIKKLQKRLEKLDLPSVDFWAERHPMFLQSALTEKILGAEMAQPLDAALFDFAKKNGKSLVGLESFGDQIEILQKLELREQFDGLSTMIKNWGRLRRSLRRTADFYERGDLQQLYRSARRTARGSRQVLLFDRNEKMTARIVELAAEKSLFAAVGAGHLEGGKGILRGLKKAGFRVKAI